MLQCAQYDEPEQSNDETHGQGTQNEMCCPGLPDETGSWLAMSDLRAQAAMRETFGEQRRENGALHTLSD
jgi:hypothetical protein